MPKWLVTGVLVALLSGGTAAAQAATPGSSSERSPSGVLVPAGVVRRQRRCKRRAPGLWAPGC
jgi:hypothetical protein